MAREKFPVRQIKSRGVWEVDCRPYGRIRSVMFPGSRSSIKLLHKEWAEEVRSTILRDIAKGVPEAVAVSPYLPRESILGAWSERWIEHLEGKVRAGDRSPNYLRRLHDYAERDWEPLLGESIYAIDYSRLEDFADDLRDAGRHPTTIVHILSSLRTCLRWVAKRSGGTYQAPEFPELRRNERDPVILTPQEQDSVLAQIPERKRGMFIALVDLLIRPGEARAADVEDYDFDARELHIRWAMKGALRSSPRRETKGRDRRLILVTDRLAQWLETHVSLRDRLKGKTPLFPGRSGRLAHSTLDDVWQAARKRADVKPCGVYEGTKHSTSTWLRSHGMSLDEIGLAMGHAHARRGMEVTEGYAQPPKYANPNIVHVLNRRHEST